MTNEMKNAMNEIEAMENKRDSWDTTANWVNEKFNEDRIYNIECEIREKIENFQKEFGVSYLSIIKGT